jgi:hypothetical protein
MRAYSMVMRAAVVLSTVMVLCAACSSAVQTPPTPAVPEVPTFALQRDPDVPELPFPDNPDPNACGIPTPWNGYAGRIDGSYQGQLVEPTVFLYDSHERLHITGAVPSGTPVQIELYQANPVLDFYFVRADTVSGPQKGWVPAPFLQLANPSS